MDSKSLKVVDLFAGCGGLSLGLEQANFIPVFVNELNEHARETYVLNRKERHEWFDRKKHPDRPFESADVKELVTTRGLQQLEGKLSERFKIERGDLDLLVGGPPCQGFSGIGHRRSYSVEKEHLPSNHLYQDMAKIIKRLQPRAFLFENVRGLLNAKWNSRGDKIWPDVLAEFQALKGYSVAFQLVFAKDYGVPQNRPRVLMVGVHRDVQADIDRKTKEDAERPLAISRGFLPGRTGGPPSLSDLLGDLIDPHYVNGGVTKEYPRAASTPIQVMLREGMGKEVSEHEYSKHSDEVQEKFEEIRTKGRIVSARFVTKKFAQRKLPSEWDEKGPTITATSLPDDYVHWAQPRTLTVREWARLQMFPDWYEFAGKRTTGGLRRAGNPREGVFEREVPKYTQIGNAVPVGLAKEVGLHLARILKK